MEEVYDKKYVSVDVGHM